MKHQPLEGQRLFIRLNRSEKNQHLIFVVCFIILAVTGFMVKLPEEIIALLGEHQQKLFYYRSIVHRVAGTIMALASVYHVGYLFLSSAGRRWFIDMMPRPKDLKEMFHNLMYYLGTRETPPEFDRFSYKQKLEYGALIAGTVLMTGSGIILWTESSWDKFILDIAAIVHAMEAVLACMAIMIWHLYEVHLRPHKFPIDNMWLTGVIPEEEMKEEFPLHYKKIMENPELQRIYIVGEPPDRHETGPRIPLVDLPGIN
ncbi:MAG: hypothetical protein C0403_04410 [Desulfobacterium sp.]|nr:hypothetical protein [Desulfobacterium sp.]